MQSLARDQETPLQPRYNVVVQTGGNVEVDYDGDCEMIDDQILSGSE